MECLYSVLTCVYKHTRSDPTNGCRGRVRFHYVPCIGYITAAVCSVCTCDSSSHVLNELIRAPAHVLEASCDTFAAQWDLVLFVKRVEYRSCSVFCVIRRRCEASSITEQVVWDSVLVCVRACVRDPNETLSEFCARSHVRKYDDVISVTEAVNIIVAVSCLFGGG